MEQILAQAKDISGVKTEDVWVYIQDIADKAAEYLRQMNQAEEWFWTLVLNV